MYLYLVILSLIGSHACPCAPLASCVVFANGSFGCMCPFFGDGVVSCERERFVTRAMVRSIPENSELRFQTLKSGAGYFLLEFDSTDYDLMEALTREINSRPWAFMLLGSATSEIVDSMTASSFARMEVTNLTYSDSIWTVSTVVTDGLVFLMPSKQSVAPSVPMAALLGPPFSVGASDRLALASGQLPVSGSQTLGMHSSITSDGAGRLLIALHELDLPQIASLYENGTFLEANFSVALLVGGDLPAVTQTHIAIRRAKGTSSSSVGSFTRQVAPYVMMQLEQSAGQVYARMWAQSTLPNATIAHVRYAWGDMSWISPSGLANHTAEGLIELWVPVDDWADDKGNLTLYVVLQSGQTLARIMTQVCSLHAPRALKLLMHQCLQCRPLVVNSMPPLHVGIEVEVLQGLQLASVYRGPAQAFFEIKSSDVDALLTLVAHSSDPLVIESVVVIHTHTPAQRAAVLFNETCDGCVVEQLILDGRVVSPRSCHMLGQGDDLAWLEGYVGLVGSSLAADVMGRMPTLLAVWINPVWPWQNDSIIEDTSFIRASMRPASSRRRLLQSSARVLQPSVFIVTWFSFMVLLTV